MEPIQLKMFKFLLSVIMVGMISLFFIPNTVIATQAFVILLIMSLITGLAVIIKIDMKTPYKMSETRKTELLSRLDRCIQKTEEHRLVVSHILASGAYSHLGFEKQAIVDEDVSDMYLGDYKNIPVVYCPALRSGALVCIPEGQGFMLHADGHTGDLR